MKRKEISDNYRSEILEVNSESVQIMWHCRYYDGPCDGVAKYMGVPYWFEMIENDSDIRSRTDENGQKWNDWYARFILVKLEDEQFVEEKKWNELFREKVGTHWDYDDQGKRVRGEVNPNEIIRQDYYDAQENRLIRDLSENEVIGWYQILWKTVEDDGES